MIKKFLIAIFAFAGVVVLLGVVKASQIQEMMAANQAPPMTAVSTTPVIADSWHPVIRSIGTLSPVQGVTISAELDGTVTEVLVENGASVKKGDLLITLDTTIERAQLAAAKARAELAGLQRDRAQELRQKDTISQSDLDAAFAQYSQAIADEAAIQATIDKKAIRAPFSGRIGIRQVNLGQYVSRGTPLMPLQKLDEVFVDFFIPQRQLPQLRIDQAVNVFVDAFPERTFLARITAINSVVDSATRNVAVQATLPNSDEALRAGMFGQLEVVLPETHDVMVVPMTAVAYASYGNSVYVIEMMTGPDGSEFLGARQQPVVLGAKRGDQIAVLQGLNGGEEVASSGVFKLRNGLPVQVNNDVQPSNLARPNPDNT